MIDVEEFIPESGGEIFEHFAYWLHCFGWRYIFCFPSLAVVCQLEIAGMIGFSVLSQSYFRDEANFLWIFIVIQVLRLSLSRLLPSRGLTILAFLMLPDVLIFCVAFPCLGSLGELRKWNLCFLRLYFAKTYDCVDNGCFEIVLILSGL